MDKLSELMRNIGYFFQDEGILCEALTHSSYRKAGKSDYDNERYEFLGDRVLNLVLSDYFFERNENTQEGELTLLLSNCHDGKTLSQIGYNLSLAKYLYIELGDIGRGFKDQRDRIVGDATEALIGGVYKDGGYESARKVVLTLFTDVLKNVGFTGRRTNKAIIQEYVQKHKLPFATTEVLEQTGPAHKPYFKVEVSVDQLGKAKGEGWSKKAAEEEASGKLVEKL